MKSWLRRVVRGEPVSQDQSAGVNTPVPASATVSEPVQAEAGGPFGRQVGRIVRVEGAVVDAQFDPAQLPAIFGEMSLTPPFGRDPVALCVVQHPAGGIVRGIGLSPLPGLVPGLEITSTGGPVSRPVPTDILLQAVRAICGSPTLLPERLETGLKAIDLLCPFVKGGKVGIFADWGTGALVLIPELRHNLARRQSGLTLFTFAPPQPDVAKWKANNTEMSAVSDEVQTVYIPVADPDDAAFRAQFDFLDAAIYLTRRLAKRGLYPAVDPLLSRSRRLDMNLVGREHVEVANRVRQDLGRYQEVQPRLEASGPASLSDDDTKLVVRAARIERFLTQPVFVAEPYTGLPGQYVSCEETLRGCRSLLAGEQDALPEPAFYMVGTLDQALEKARQLAG